jgi:hypothetical protein
MLLWLFVANHLNCPPNSTVIRNLPITVSKIDPPAAVHHTRENGVNSRYSPSVVIAIFTGFPVLCIDHDIL